MKYQINKLLIVVVLLAAVLRFFMLDSLPPSLTWDEAAWGYNSYALGIDGKDEYGRFLPFNYLESFGDFKPPLYAYLSIIPVKIFSLNEFSVRFASAFFGTFTVLITYLLVKRIFHDPKNERGNTHDSENIDLMSAFILAISPWHILLARAAFEANVASFLLSTAVWLFLKGIEDEVGLKSFILSAVIFVLSMYTFNT